MNDEEQFTPDWFSKPGDSLRALMQRRGVASSEVAEQLQGGMVTLRRLLDGSASIDVDHASVLASTLGGTISFWLKRQSNYDTALRRAADFATATEADEWLQLPIPGGRPRGRLSKQQQREEVQRRLAFFNVGTIKAWETRYGRLRANTLFRTSQTFMSQDGPLLMWLRCGELGSDLVSTRKWNANSLKDRLSAIRSLTRIRQPDRFLPKLKALCAEAGVAVVIVKAPPGCRASGASCMVAPDKAMILLSFRYRSDDQFWFTVFHEIGHLILHGAQTFLDDDRTEPNDRESEANEFASKCIIPECRVAEFEKLRTDKDAVIRFSVSIGVSPGLTVGQMQHRQMIRSDQLNYLKRRWSLNELTL